ncbi:aldo/keto reductase [Chloroflexi bacterium TSY]|nr:aldo/keto reductase [Chloroflexi bacterium TSY]
MEYGTIPGIDKPISRLVQGAVMISTDRLEESFELLDGVFAQGCTTFDTASSYAGGECDRTLGRWINERGIEDKVVILGKGAHHNRDRERVTPFDITSDLFDSLARLKVDKIDLYVLHRDNLSLPVGPIVEILNEHHDAGRIGEFGGSNWSAARIQEANEYADKHGLKPFAVSSPNFSLAVQIKPPWLNCVSISSPSRSKFGVFGDFQSRLQGFWSHLFRFRLQKTTYFISENRPNLTQKLDIDRQICIYVNCLARILSQNLKFGSTEPRASIRTHLVRRTELSALHLVESSWRLL